MYGYFSIQLTRDLTGSATAPFIKKWTTNMVLNLSQFTMMGQISATGRKLAAPIAYSTSGTVCMFDFKQFIVVGGIVALGLKYASGSYQAYGSGYLSRIGANVPLQLAILKGVTIITTYKTLIGLSDPYINGYNSNEYEKREIFLVNAEGDQYWLQLFLFNNLIHYHIQFCMDLHNTSLTKIIYAIIYY